METDTNIKKSKNQYQILKNRKLSFKASDLSKHPIKNLQSTINILTDKEDNEKENMKEVPELSNQRKPLRHSFPGGFSKSNKGKEKDIRDQSNTDRNKPSSGGGDSDSSSSSDEEDLNPRKSWHLKA